MQIDRAMRFYYNDTKGKKAKKPMAYKFLHCWQVLRHERKWMDYVDSVNARNKAKAARCASMAHPGAVDAGDGDATPETRPMGRDAAKKRRSGDATSTAASAYAECMQALSECRRLQQQTEAGWALDYKTVEYRKIALEEQKREDAKLAREDAILAREDAIMRMELNRMDLTLCQRRYWEREQERILQRREQQMAPPSPPNNHQGPVYGP